MNIIRNEHGEACADLTNLKNMEAERGEIKETTREELQEIAKRNALEIIGEALDNIGSRLTKKRRAYAMGAIHCARVQMIRNADTTAQDVRAALAVLGAVDEGRNLAEFHDWKNVPAIVVDLLERLGYTVERVAEEPAEETAEATEEPKTIAQRFAEKRAEREAFEAFKAAYFETHPSTAKQYAAGVRIVEGFEQLAKEVRRDIEAAQRGDEMAAHGPAGIGPNGLPLYYAEGFRIVEASEYVEELNARAAEVSARVAKILDKIRKAYEAEQPAEATESTQDARARAAYLHTCDECDALEATGDAFAMHEGKKMRTLAAEAYAYYLRTHAPEWVQELECLEHEARPYSPESLRKGSEFLKRMGYNPEE